MIQMKSSLKNLARRSSRLSDILQVASIEVRRLCGLTQAGSLEDRLAVRHLETSQKADSLANVAGTVGVSVRTSRSMSEITDSIS